MGLGVERSRAALYRQIKNELTRPCTETRTRPVLVLDEAQGVRSDVLEEIRLLTNHAMDSQNRLCLLFCGQTELRWWLSMAVHEPLAQRIVVRHHLAPLASSELRGYLAQLLRLVLLCLLFCGQTELRRRLSMAVHEPLAQRIVVRYHLAPLASGELRDYLAHLLRLAGTELPLFEPAAIEAIFQATQGLPRKANSIAHHTLIAATVAKAKAASVDHVQTALAAGLMAEMWTGVN
jgi:type II secretory pathway predicted ATPase ExeA